MDIFFMLQTVSAHLREQQFGKLHGKYNVALFYYIH